MIFESLYDSAQKNEIILIDSGLLRFHRRRDGVIKIYEILVSPESARGKGIGTRLLNILRSRYPFNPIEAKCPSDLSANRWYEKMGFEKISQETLKSGRMVNTWRLI